MFSVFLILATVVDVEYTFFPLAITAPTFRDSLNMPRFLDFWICLPLGAEWHYKSDFLIVFSLGQCVWVNMISMLIINILCNCCCRWWERQVKAIFQLDKENPSILGTCRLLKWMHLYNPTVGMFGMQTWAVRNSCFLITSLARISFTGFQGDERQY